MIYDSGESNVTFLSKFRPIYSYNMWNTSLHRSRNQIDISEKNRYQGQSISAAAPHYYKDLSGSIITHLRSGKNENKKSTRCDDADINPENTNSLKSLIKEMILSH